MILYATYSTPSGKQHWEVYDQNGRAYIIRTGLHPAEWASPDRTAAEWVSIQRFASKWTIVKEAK